ncbi:MAG: acyl-CoA thioesterase [Deltaproteobacteria bacterium]|nr:acyl-CoA thioesterase [Deltaproteobacteria bacterium]
MFEVEMTVAPANLQPLYNHLHHAKSLEFCEIARLRYLESVGFPSDDYIKRGLFWVIVSISADYKREIRAGQIRVTCENVLVQDKLLILDQRIYNERGKLAVEATAHSMLLSSETGRSIQIPSDFRDAVTALNAKVAS